MTFKNLKFRFINYYWCLCTNNSWKVWKKIYLQGHGAQILLLVHKIKAWQQFKSYCHQIKDPILESLILVNEVYYNSIQVLLSTTDCLLNKWVTYVAAFWWMKMLKGNHYTCKGGNCVKNDFLPPISTVKQFVAILFEYNPPLRCLNLQQINQGVMKVIFLKKKW